MGPFEAFYASPVAHPILLWLAAGCALGFCATRSGLDPAVRRYCFVLTGLSVADAWLTSSHVYGLGVLSAGVASSVSLFFVLAGDFRFLLLLGIATRQGGIAFDRGRLLGALGLTAIVPLCSQAVVATLGEPAGGARVLFLVYEIAFLLLTGALLRWHPGPRSVPWLLPVGRVVFVYYGLWACADAIILATGADLGFLLRIVPNLLYYGGLIAVIGQAASRR